MTPGARIAITQARCCRLQDAAAGDAGGRTGDYGGGYHAGANCSSRSFRGGSKAGRDVTSHSMSHTYYTNVDALEVQYTSAGTAATLSINAAER